MTNLSISSVTLLIISWAASVHDRPCHITLFPSDIITKIRIKQPSHPYNSHQSFSAQTRLHLIPVHLLVLVQVLEIHTSSLRRTFPVFVQRFFLLVVLGIIPSSGDIYQDSGLQQAPDSQVHSYHYTCVMMSHQETDSVKSAPP